VEDSQPEVKSQPPIAGMHEDIDIDDLYTKYKVSWLNRFINAARSRIIKFFNLRF
jgi:hypothetical protein